MKQDAEKITKIFKGMDDPTRVAIVEYLTRGEQCACMLISDLNIPQSTLSHHMRILCDSGLVNGRKVGKWMYYSLSKEGFGELIDYLNELQSSEPAPGCKTCCC